MTQQPQQRRYRECDDCKRAGFPNQPIAFEKIGEDPQTHKNIWKILDENGNEHQHKGNQPQRGSGRPRTKVGKVIYEGSEMDKVNEFLAAEKYNELFAAVPTLDASNPVVYIVVRRVLA